MSERISIDALQPGMVIVQITRQNGPVKIRKSGLVTSAAMVQGLAEMGVLELEIDPEQTVEIDVPVHYATQTQALLRGQHDTGASSRFEHSLSDQFNRSLFLPTVQGLPSIWKVYVRQVVIITLLIVGGFSIGFTAATPSRWWPALTQQQQSAIPSIPPTTVVQTVTQNPERAGQTTSVVQDSRPDERDPTAVSAAKEPKNANAESAPPTDKVTAEDAKSEASTQADAANNVGRQNDRPQTAQQDLGGEILNDREESNVKVSPELLAKFNQAVEELDDNVVDKDNQPEIKLTVRDDMPRVDQLPVRILTRLPSMSFSAHMYASRPSDRWVRVNGKQLGEGDWIGEDIQIVNIEAQRVILSFEGEVFSMAALTDW
ncbi:GspB domain-containing protein [Alteromonas pelagimontana]|uniref:GspB domain-containing protein n=1 Tax=Alteromonas pelagimontana TaxID=1858656 RepID=A0A6M4MF46_9ALTE|nr:general secretion pathway protein GspB [Alteromonas pelagimontana]QJR81722.1 GspB domain-containing protein [Alteromonas pelagimontana]